MKKKIKNWRRQGKKLKINIFNFLSMLFGNKDFISRESPILAQFKNILSLNWQDIHVVGDFLEKKITKKSTKSGGKKNVKMPLYLL